MDHTQIKRIAVLGAGLMGHGIAQEFALAGYQVRLHDLSDDRLGTALSNIRANLRMLSSLGRLDNAQIDPALAAITACTELGKTVSGAGLVIEAIIEDLGAKHAILGSVEALCGRETLLASNTSSFMPSRLAQAVSRPDRLLVAHYFNPPYLIPLVEIVPGPETSNATIAAMVGLLKQVGKAPVVLRKEATGFVGNRLQFALFREALAIVEQGIAGPEAVDQVVRFGFGRRLAAAGPFEVFDLAGLDTIAAVAAEIFPELATAGPSGQEVPEFLRQKVQQGALGVKSGRGFHEWTEEKIEELRTRLTRASFERPGASSGIDLVPSLQCWEEPDTSRTSAHETRTAMKTVITQEAAVALIPDGATIMIGGFFGVGTPHRLIEGLVTAGRKDLAIVTNDTAYPGLGVGKLIAARLVKRLVTSHIGANPETQRQMIDGELQVELVPQGTLAERIRAGGFGLGGVLTRTGLGTLVEQAKTKLEIDGETWLLEKPLRADFALVCCKLADTVGNLTYELTAQNFNPVMAMAAGTVIAEAEEIVPVGTIPPDAVRTPGVVVDYLLERQA